MQVSDNGFPRRIRVDRFTPAETAIAAAVEVVERTGAHPRLTDAVILLQSAVADAVEEMGLTQESAIDTPRDAVIRPEFA